MSALIADLSKRWPGEVPYVIGGKLEKVEKFWLLDKIYEFNRAIDHDVFVPHRGEANYIEFQDGGNSPLGMQGGRQECNVSVTNLFHEMGHALGLGHTYYTAGSQIHELFESIDKHAYESNRHEYVSHGAPNAPSMMAYSPTAFSTSPRIARVARLTRGRRGDLPRVLAEAQQRKIAVATAPVTRPSLFDPLPTKKKGVTRSLEEPTRSRGVDVDLDKPRSRGLDLLDTPRKKTTVDPDDIRQMDKATVTQLVGDLELIQRYWSFEEGFMLRVHPTDREAVREVLGLTKALPTPGRLTIPSAFGT